MCRRGPRGGSLGGPWGVSAGPPRPPRNDPKQKVLIPFGINLKISVRDWKVSHTNPGARCAKWGWVHSPARSAGGPPIPSPYTFCLVFCWRCMCGNLFFRCVRHLASRAGPLPSPSLSFAFRLVWRVATRTFLFFMPLNFTCICNFACICSPSTPVRIEPVAVAAAVQAKGA